MSKVKYKIHWLKNKTVYIFSSNDFDKFYNINIQTHTRTHTAKLWYNFLLRYSFIIIRIESCFFFAKLLYVLGTIEFINT